MREGASDEVRRASDTPRPRPAGAVEDTAAQFPSGRSPGTSLERDRRRRLAAVGRRTDHQTASAPTATTHVASAATTRRPRHRRQAGAQPCRAAPSSALRRSRAPPSPRGQTRRRVCLSRLPQRRSSSSSLSIAVPFLQQPAQPPPRAHGAHLRGRQRDAERARGILHADVPHGEQQEDLAVLRFQSRERSPTRALSSDRTVACSGFGRPSPDSNASSSGRHSRRLTIARADLRRAMANTNAAGESGGPFRRHRCTSAVSVSCEISSASPGSPVSRKQ